MKHLVLSGNRLAAPGTRALANGPWNQLQSLDLSSIHCGNEGTQALCAAKDWPHQAESSRQQNRPSGAAALQLSKWPKLQTLDLSQNYLDTESFWWLNRASWPALVSLNLSRNIPDSGSGQALLSAAWPWLTHLNISHCDCLETRTMADFSKGRWALINSVALLNSAAL